MEKIFNCSNCLSMQYDLLKGMLFDTKEETKNYLLCTSKVMNNYYWNLAYLKSKVDDNILLEIENKLKKRNCIPCMYIGRYDEYFKENKELLLNRNYQIKDTDVYMILSNHKDIDINLKIKVVETEDEYEDFMKVLNSAYNDNIENADEIVYDNLITKCYYDAVKNSINNGKTYHIIGYNEENIPVSVATLNIVDTIGGINNVGTAQGYWNRGYSKQILTYLINFFESKGGKDLILCAEYHSKNQKYYEKIGFEEIYVMEQYCLTE